MALSKNEYIEMDFTGMTAEGAAVGRYEGEAVFVPMGAPGDRALVKIVKAAKTHAFGRLEKLLKPSPCRVEPDCPVYRLCGGCCFRHITYQAELEIKEQKVRDALERIGGIKEPPLGPIIGAKDRDGYRNKALLPIGQAPDGGIELGFYAKNSHRIVPCESCKLQPEEFSRAMEAFRQWAKEYGDPVYDEVSHSGRMRRLFLRKAGATGEVMACVVVNGNGLHHEPELVDAMRGAVPGLKSLVINSNRERTNVALGGRCRTVWGRDSIRDRLCGLEFEISPLSFYQVNRDQTEKLYRLAAEYAAPEPGDLLLDLYCGTGTIGLSIAKSAGKLIGVEVQPQAVENARENARRNGIDNAEFLCADAAEAARELVRRGTRPQVVLLDPPRKGCGPKLVETVAEMGPQRVVYVSCDPATLARDLRQFAGLGYGRIKGRPVDMFPGTGHVETVCLLSKLHADQHIEVELQMDELDLTAAESKATYEEIKDYVLEHTRLKVSSLYIAQVKEKCGIIERVNYNLPKSENSRQPKCPPEKEAAIREALEHFRMI